MMIGRMLSRMLTTMLVIVVLTLTGMESMAQEKVLIRPMATPLKQFNRLPDNQINQSNDHTKHGYIQFNSELVSPLLNIKANDTIRLTFFDDASYDVVVETVTHNQNSTISITGKITDHLFSTVTMTLDKDSFLIVLKDLKKNYEYTAHGKIIEGLGVIKEVNINKAPEKIHLQPLEVR